MVIRLSPQYVKKIILTTREYVSDREQDEMAIPTYLHPNPCIRWLFWKRFELMLPLSGIRKNSTVLDFGCGLGTFLPTLFATGGKIYALDILPYFAQTLALDMNLDVNMINDLSDLSDATIDIIFAADVLEHLNALENILTRLHQKLRKGGRLIVSAPTETRIYQIGKILAGFINKKGYHHCAADDLKTLIEENGFKLSAMRTLPFRIPPYLFKVFRFETE